MTVKQISVFLETTTDGLMEFTKVLQENDIDIRAFLISAEAPDFSIARVIVDDFDRTVGVLKNAGYVTSISQVMGVAIPDRAGGLYDVLNLFSNAGIRVKYTYAFTGRQKGMAYRAFYLDDQEKAEKLLMEHGIMLIDQEDLICTVDGGCL